MTMNESLAIDFRPGEGTVPRILHLVDDHGFTLHAIRLVPTRAAERATLRIDIGGRSSAMLRDLEHRLVSLDGIIEVIHRANI